MTSTTSELGDAGEPLSAGASLGLIEREQHKLCRRRGTVAALICGSWGAAYLLGFGAVYLASSTSAGRGAQAAAAGLAVALFVGAAVTTVGLGRRAVSGIRGPSREVDVLYGSAWLLGFAAAGAINVGMSRLGLSADAVTLLSTADNVLVVGVLYLASGALLRDRLQYGLGLWMLVTAAVSVPAGAPANFAVLALAGGGGLLAAAGCYAARRPRLDPAT